MPGEDHNSENEFDCQELHELALMRAQLVQLALLTSLQQEVKLEDVRSPTERVADLSAFGPHDMANGPTRMETKKTPTRKTAILVLNTKST